HVLARMPPGLVGEPQAEAFGRSKPPAHHMRCSDTRSKGAGSMRRGISIVSAIAFVASAVAIAVTMTPASAGPPPPALNPYVILGTDGVTIGVGSTVIGLVGDFNNNPLNNQALRMNGQAQIIGDASKGLVGDARIGGNTRLDNNAHIEGTLTHPAGTTVNL